MPAVSGSTTQIATSCLTALALAGTPDDAFKDGDLGWVDALDSLFVLRRGVAPYAANNTTLIDAYSGNGYWMISGAPGLFWQNVADWYVDEITGSDNNSGTTQGSPVATFAEIFQRRLAGATTVITANVHVLSDMTTGPVVTDLPAGSYVKVTGDLGMVVTGSGNITAVAGYAPGSVAANQHYEIDIAGGPTAPELVGSMLRIASGATCFGAYSVDANTLRTNSFVDQYGNEVVPVVESFDIVTCPTISSGPTVDVSSTTYVEFAQLWLTQDGGSLAGNTTFTACRFYDGIWNFYRDSHYLIGSFLYSDGASTRLNVQNGSLLITVRDAHVSNSLVNVLSGGTAFLTQRTLMQDGARVDTETCANVKVGDLAVFNTDGVAIDLSDNCTFSIDSLSDYIYGTGNLSRVIRLGRFVRATYVDVTHLIATGPGAPYNGVQFIGYANQTFASLPTIKTAAAADTQSAFIVGS